MPRKLTEKLNNHKQKEEGEDGARLRSDERERDRGPGEPSEGLRGVLQRGGGPPPRLAARPHEGHRQVPPSQSQRRQ